MIPAMGQRQDELNAQMFTVMSKLASWDEDMPFAQWLLANYFESPVLVTEIPPTDLRDSLLNARAVSNSVGCYDATDWLRARYDALTTSTGDGTGLA
jgi:hypothetical protein